MGNLEFHCLNLLRFVLSSRAIRSQTWVVLGEAFIYNEQKFSSQVGLDITVPWRVVPGDPSFLGFALSCCPLCLWIDLKDVRAHCYCGSLVHMLFIGHARATSFSSACTESKTQQNIEPMIICTWEVLITSHVLFK